MPVSIHFPQLRVASHPGLHPLFEALAYAVAFAWYRRSRARQPDPLRDGQRWNILAAAAVGALVGSRLLGVLEQVPGMHPFRWRIFLAPGGWIAVEVAKSLAGIRARTGDLFAIPLCIGIAVGRVGCFLAGLADDTYGKPTPLPWAVDFGDGVPRHPTQIYEIVFLAALAGLLFLRSRRPHREGGQFRVFLAAYLAFRFFVESLKPQPLVLGLNLIQWSCLAGLAALAIGLASARGTSMGAKTKSVVAHV